MVGPQRIDYDYEDVGRLFLCRGQIASSDSLPSCDSCFYREEGYEGNCCTPRKQTGNQV